MHLMKILYAILFVGSIAYFFLYGLVMKKSPIIRISYEKDSIQTLQEEIRQIRLEKLGNKEENSAEPINLPKGTNLTILHTTNLPFKARELGPGDVVDETDSTGVVASKMEDFLFNFRNDNEFNQKASTEDQKEISTSVRTESKTRKKDLPKLMKIIDLLEKETRSTDDALPECRLVKRVGPLNFEHVEEKASSSLMRSIEKELSFVSEGGRWKPVSCSAKKVAIVVPFRDRQQHLILFLLHMHRFLRWQLLDYKIYVIEQSSQHPFNRGMLMNIGFEEALKQDKYDCVIFHDVDLLPEDDRNDYSCPSSPRHMSTAVDTMDYKLAYKKIFGGVEAFWPDHFRLTNGFPNRYWGWGGEDDDLYVRVMEKKSLGLTRPAYQIGRYTMIKHEKSVETNPQRHRLLSESKEYMNEDGLSSLKYDITKQQQYKLYTHISVDIQPANDIAM